MGFVPGNTSTKVTTLEASQRIRIDLAYDGSLFHGWAKQPGLRTVEGELTTALGTIWRQDIAVTVAGRTDAGVHAAAQVAHFDSSLMQWQTIEKNKGQAAKRIQGLLARQFSELVHTQNMSRSLTKHAFQDQMPDIIVHQVEAVSSDFDARFSATGRKYCYRIGDEQTKIDPRRRADVLYLPRTRVDVDKIQEVLEDLLGLQDFLSFCRPRPGATTIRTLRRIEVDRNEDRIICFRLEADAFCHSMVRSLVGALVEVGRGRRDRDWIRALLLRPCREHGVPIIGARGLTLEEVEYPPADQWEKRARESRAKRTSE